MAGEETFFLRLAEQPGERRDAEVRAHQLLAEMGVPVPAIVMYEPAPPELDRSATLTARMRGAPLLESSGLEADDVRRIARAAGRDLARINQLPVQGFGWVESAAVPDRSLIAEHSTRSAWTEEYKVAVQEIATSDLFSSGSLDLLKSAIARWRARPGRAQSFLAHGDFDATHIFMSASTYTYTGIIDFGEIRGADWLYDLGHALLQDAQPGRAPIFPDLLAGYREIMPLPDTITLEICDQAIAIGTRQLAIFQRRSSPYTRALAAQIETLLRGMCNVA